MDQNWKKHLRKIPDVIDSKLPSLGASVVVAAVKKLPVSDLRTGLYEHLGLGLV